VFPPSRAPGALSHFCKIAQSVDLRRFTTTNMLSATYQPEDDINFDLRHYLIIFRRFWVLFVVIPLIGAAAGGIVSVRTPRVYQSQTSLLLRPAQPIASNDPTAAQLTSDQIASTYATLITEPPLLQQVISELHLPISPAEFSRDITVTAIPNTTILSVAAQADRPTLAADIANRLVGDFVVSMRQIQSSSSSSKTGPPGDDFVVVAKAVPVSTPVSPSLKKDVAVGFAGGLGLTVLVVITITLLDQTVKKDEDLFRRTGLLALAHIPKVPAARGPLGELAALTADSASAEAYRVLRTNLIFSGVDHPAHGILVTSASPHEGKSRTAANLAISLSQAGYRTLLVDADLRRPSQHLTFRRIRNLGLTNLILEDVPEDRLFSSDVNVPNLWLLASGPIPPNPAELLGSTKMQALLHHLSTSYDFLVVDSPPVTAVTDPCILATRLDGCLLVVEQRHSKYADVARAKAQIERVGGHVIGVVLNKIQGPEATYYGYGYSSDDQSEKYEKPPTRTRPGASGHDAALSTNVDE